MLSTNKFTKDVINNSHEKIFQKPFTNCQEEDCNYWLHPSPKTNQRS